MNKENLAKAEEAMQKHFFGGRFTSGDTIGLANDIAQALQEKDEAHKAKIARIREAVIESKDFSGTHSDGYYGYCRQLKKTLSAFNSAVNGKE